MLLFHFCSFQMLCSKWVVLRLFTNNSQGWWKGRYICFPKKLSFFADNWIVFWLRARVRILLGIPKRRVTGGVQLAIQPLFPSSFSCTHLPKCAAGRWDQKTKTLVHFLIYFYSGFILCFFIPSNGLLTYPFTPQDWVDLTALWKGLNNFHSWTSVSGTNLSV